MKNKKIVISCSILLIIMLLIIVYIKTDFLKTNEQLFWKYMLKNEKLVHIFSSEEIKKYSENISKSAYINKTNILLETKNKTINPLKIYIEENGNNQINCSNININLVSNSNIKLIANIIKDENYFLFNNGKIENKYIGFENKDLKKLANKLGINKTTYIPNEINSIDYLDFFLIKEEEKEYIINTYIPIFRKHIKNKNYIKINSETFEMSITQKEFDELIIELLEKIYNDEKILEFISKKIEIIDKDNQYTNIEQLKEKIYKLINDFQNEKCDEKNFLSIIIYKKEDSVEKIEIVLKDRKINIQYNNEDQSIIINQYDVEEKELDTSDIEKVFKFIIDSISEINYTRKIEEENKSKICGSIILDFGLDKFNITFDSTTIVQPIESVNITKRKKDVEFVDLRSIISNEKLLLPQMYNIIQIITEDC